MGQSKRTKREHNNGPEAELSHKRPGPMQRYTSSGAKRKKIARSPKAIVKGS